MEKLNILQKAALRWKEVKALEWDDHMVRDRGMEDYSKLLLGLDGFFNQVRASGSLNVIDVGAGTTRAAVEMRDSSLGEGIGFTATGLVLSEEVREYLGEDQMVITPAEVMRGVKDSSCGGVLAANSVAYSSAPNLVTYNMDRVLVPGGMFKGSFLHPSLHNEYSIMETAEEFERIFKEMGYETEVEDNVALETQVLSAIKPFD